MYFGPIMPVVGYFGVMTGQYIQFYDIVQLLFGKLRHFPFLHFRVVTTNNIIPIFTAKNTVFGDTQNGDHAHTRTQILLSRRAMRICDAR